MNPAWTPPTNSTPKASGSASLLERESWWDLWSISSTSTFSSQPSTPPCRKPPWDAGWLISAGPTGSLEVLPQQQWRLQSSCLISNSNGGTLLCKITPPPHLNSGSAKTAWKTAHSVSMSPNISCMWSKLATRGGSQGSFWQFPSARLVVLIRPLRGKVFQTQWCRKTQLRIICGCLTKSKNTHTHI